MPWNVLIFPILGGFVFLSTCNNFRYRYQRLDAQRLVFASVLVGVGLLAVGVILRWLFLDWQPEICASIRNEVPLEEPFSLTVIASLPLAIIITLGWNVFVDREAAELRAINRYGGALEKLCANSAFNFNDQTSSELDLLMFTLSSDKVYVGICKERPHTPKPYIVILPLISGYRTAEQRVTFNTFYNEVYQHYMNDRSAAQSDYADFDNEVVFAEEEVVSASTFDLEMYTMFPSS